MRKETWSVGLACALGAFIGALSALEIASYFTHGSYFWAIGALFGGFVAYCAVDFRHFCAGVARSYRAAIAWWPDTLYWKVLFSVFGALAVAANSVLWMFAGIVMYFADTDDSITRGFLAVSFVYTSISFCCGCWAASPGNKADKVEVCSSSLKAMRDWNPIGILYWTIIGLAWVAVRTPSAVMSAGRSVGHAYRMLKKFFIGVFINVHSDRRTLCFVDAALGATAGFFLGSAIAGAVIGAILGVFNYEIVSIKWLKLVPAKAK